MKHNNLFIKLLTLTVSTLLLVVGLTACGGNNDDAAASFRTLDEIKESGKIVIGVFSDKAPFGYIDENGEYQGYDVYLLNELQKTLVWKLNMFPLTRPAALNMLPPVKLISSWPTSLSLKNAHSRSISLCLT